jgi:hypothetical protein
MKQIINYVKLFTLNKIEYIIVSLLSLAATFSWLKVGYVIANGDSFPFTMINPDKWINQIPFTWNNLFNGGGEPNFQITYIVSVLFSYCLKSMSLPAYLIQFIIYSSLFICQGLSIVYFLKVLFPDHKRSSSIIVGSIFYNFNVFLLYWIPPQVMAMLSMILIPLLGGLLVKAYTTRKNIYIILFSIISILLSGVFVNPPMIVIILIFVLIIIGYLIIQLRRVEIKTLLKIAGLTLLINLFWIIPVYMCLFTQGNTNVSADVSLGGWDWSMVRNSFLNIFWLSTTFGWNELDYYPYSIKYNSIIMLFVFIPTIFVFCINLLKRKVQKIVIYFLTLLVLLFLISKGIHQPFGFIYNLFQKIPGFWLFREPALKFFFIIITIYSILIVKAFETIKINRRDLKIFTSSALILIILAISFPIWNGEAIPDKKPNYPPAHAKIPEYWEDLKCEKLTGKVIVLPNNDFYQMPYTWGMYSADFLSEEIINSEVIKVNNNIEGYTYYSNNYFQATNIVLQVLQGNKLIDFKKAIDNLGVNYLIVRKDIDFDFTDRPIISPYKIEELLKTINGIDYYKSVGEIDIYRNTQPVSAIYANNKANFYKGDFFDNYYLKSISDNGSVFIPYNNMEQNNSFTSEIIINKNDDVFYKFTRK